ncbi:MAG: hypothetical protein IT435_07660 [Phycisphaerales bacterium]|nr:hypothetical protein [Phycisphaerales bacterium]
MARSRTSGVIRKTSISRFAAAGLLGMGATLAHADRILVFSDDFEAAQVRSEWSGAHLEQAGELTQIAGRMTRELVDLKVPPPAENMSHTGKVVYYMTFDLFTLDGWTGKTEDGKDTRFEVQVGEKLMFSHSLSTLVAQGSYRNADKGPAPLVFGTAPDSVYRGVIVAFELDAADELAVQFRALGLDPRKDYGKVSALLNGASEKEAEEAAEGDPAWGIDNVVIWCEIDHSGGGGSAGREVEPPFVDGAMGSIGGPGTDPFSTGGQSVPRPPLQTWQAPAKRDLMPPGHTSSPDRPGEEVITPFTPPEETKPKDEPDPNPDPQQFPKDDPTPPVPGPAVWMVAIGGMSMIARRKRA